MSIYLSYFIENNTPVYGGKEGTIHIEQSRSINKGDTTNELKISMPNHIGTHIDFPFHFSDKGKKSNDYPADYWISNKIGFLQCSIEEMPQQINELPGDTEFLFVKTGFAKKRGEQEYWASQPVIPAAYASMLKRKFSSLRVFGFDMISLTSKLDRAEGSRAHISFLLENEILVLEDMDLSSLHSTPSTVIISPLQLKEADGVPCTVIATH